MSDAALSNEEILRYSRHLLMPELGLAGQRRLKQGRVLLIGTGGLGSPVALYLAAAGVGQLGLVDCDVVDASNLQRQVIHGTGTLGMPKTDSAQQRLRDLNPLVEVTTYPVRLSATNALALMRPYDLIIDGSDNFPTRYLINDASVLLGKPNVYGSIFRFEGQATVFSPQQGGPCYRCLYPEPPPPGLVPSCAEGGVLGVLPAVIGSIQATEAIKLLTGIGEPLLGRLLLYDALAMRFRELKLRRNPNCPLCGEHPSLTELSDYEQYCGSPSETTRLDTQDEITPAELAARLAGEKCPYLLDVRSPSESAIASLPGTDKCIPVEQLAERLHELDRSLEIVVYCRSGVRSERAVSFLKDAGFHHVKHLRGGILHWSDEVDPSVVKY